MNVPLCRPENPDGLQSKAAPAPRKRRRVQALDAFRGMTVMNMILVDNAGGAYPVIDHSPWNGVSLADMTMPMFDFIVGCSVALAFSKLDKTKSEAKWVALRKAWWRFVKLFLLGIWNQGGYNMFQYDMTHLRIMGILQRVAVCYLIAAVIEIYGDTCCMSSRKTRNTLSSTHAAVFKRSVNHWVGIVALCSIWTCIMYGVTTPSEYNETCVRGKFTPACNPQRLVDAALFGVDHMYFPTNGGNADGRGMTFNRLPQCSSCSPGLCLEPRNMTALNPWCGKVPFDPEGIVSQLTAAAGTLTGVYIGKVLVEFNEETHRQRMNHWLVFAFSFISLGIVLHATAWMPLNTDLFSLSFLLVTSGTGAALLSFWYLLIDVWQFKKVAAPFIWVGKNAVVMYIAAEAGIIQWCLSIFYWDGDTKNNLSNILWPGSVWGVESSLNERFENTLKDPHDKLYVLVWTLGYILIWVGVAWWMDRQKWYISI